MSFMFGSPEPPPTPDIPPPVERDDPEVKRRAEELRLANKRRRGRAATRLTKPGLGNVAAPVQQKTLLGE